MDHFQYINNTLHTESVAINDLAARYGTPCYIYSTATILDHYQKLAYAFAPLNPLICFAVKSCSNVAILKLLVNAGAGLDIVSGGELHRALLTETPSDRIVFAGVGKSDAEIREALEAGIACFNIESEQEFLNLCDIARQLRTTCTAALRVNPDVDPDTHAYTTTGTRNTKFGIDIAEAAAFFDRHARNPYCRLCGIHLHIGSPVYGPESFEHAIRRALLLIGQLRNADHEVTLLDIGGGFGADYQTGRSPDAATYASHIVPILQAEADRGTRIIIEPGRSIIANAGLLLLRVLYTKQSGKKRFAICDGGMNIMIRPALYDAFHFIWPVNVAPHHIPAQRRDLMDMPGLQAVDIVGPICETGDFLALDRALPPLIRGNLLAVFTAGAYGSSMASHYNSHPLPPEVLVDGHHATLIRRRETYDDLTSHESLSAARTPPQRKSAVVTASSRRQEVPP